MSGLRCDEHGVLHWTDLDGGTLTVGPEITSGVAPKIVISGHRLGLLDARLVEQALRELRHAIEAARRAPDSIRLQPESHQSS